MTAKEQAQFQSEEFVRQVLAKAFDQKIDEKALKRAAKNVARALPSNYKHIKAKVA